MAIIKPNISLEEEDKSYPSYETIKNYIITKVIMLSQLKNEITKLRFDNVKDYETIKEFVAELSELFTFLKPYIYRRQNKFLRSINKDGNTNISVQEFIRACDEMFLDPRTVIEKENSLESYEILFDILNDFIFEMGVTDIGQFFAGVKVKKGATREIDDISEVR